MDKLHRSGGSDLMTGTSNREAVAVPGKRTLTEGLVQRKPTPGDGANAAGARPPRTERWPYPPRALMPRRYPRA
jgi:hypothetical protein